MKSYRDDHSYDMETFYLMENFDGNGDGRLSRQEAIAMAYEIANGDINDRTVKLYWEYHGPKGEEVSGVGKGNG
jgi:hypothetical protein